MPTADTHRSGAAKQADSLDFSRRALLRGAGALAAVAGVSGVAAARHTTATGGAAMTTKGYYGRLDSTFGHASLGPVPDWFPASIEPSHVVEAAIDFSPEEGYGFFFKPTGLHVRPGDVLLLKMASPEHAFTAYHAGFGRQNRVPAGVGPISSPLLPFGPPTHEGYWLYRFVHEGVYDYFCPPHEVFGMVGRVVVYDDEGTGEIPSADFAPPGETERPPDDVNVLNLDEVSGAVGLPPWAKELPSAAETFEHPFMTPENIVSEGAVEWTRLVDDIQSDSAGAEIGTETETGTETEAGTETPTPS